MSTYHFPDVNVWLALAHRIHPHHRAAYAWATQTNPSDSFYLCRVAQLSILRLLTQSSAMGTDVLTQAGAWSAYDRLAEFWGIVLLEEPLGFDLLFRKGTMRDEISPRYWADAYLVAFAQGHQLNLITFDKVLAGRVRGSILLKG